MEDFILFLFQQFGNLFVFLDSFTIFGSLSFFKLFIILFLLSFVFKLLKGGSEK